MIKLFFTGVLFACNICFVNAQARHVLDSIQQELRKKGEVIFTLSEKMPEFKNGKPAFQDTLTAYLKIRNELPDSGLVSLRLIVSKSGEILGGEALNETRINAETIINAFKALSVQWKPGTQNKQDVNVYRRLDVEFSGGQAFVSLLKF